jgi:ATP-dependent exoDNAse (exonuclease V) beta subunit
MITFNKEAHSYTNEHGEKYISVTTLIGKHFPPFQADMIAGFIAKKQGVSAEEIKQQWKDKATEGTRLHNVIENDIYFNDGIDIKGTFYKRCSSLEEFLSTSGGVLSEFLLYSDKHKVAGTSDLILKHEDKIFILDFKTGITEDVNKAYSGKVDVPKEIGVVKNSKFHKYSIQAWIYSILFESMTGFPITNTYILPIDSSWDGNFTNLFENKLKNEYFKDVALYILNRRLEQ